MPSKAAGRGRFMYSDFFHHKRLPMKARFSRVFFLMGLSMLFFHCSDNNNEEVDQLFANYNHQTPGELLRSSRTKID